MVALISRSLYMNLKIKNKLKNIPDKPGIYFWLGKKQDILYVGRANNLRARLRQYAHKDLDSRIAEMVALSIDIKYQETDTILESIILEAENIKKYWPKYNIVDRDDRSFIYLFIPKNKYPQPIIIRGQDLPGFSKKTGTLFGPYQSFYLLKNALRIIRRVFPYSTCTPGSMQACFDYQVGLCPGLCVNKISATDYQKNIRNIMLLLSGRKKQLFKTLKKDNPDQLKAWQQIQDVTLLGQEFSLNQQAFGRLEAYDISHHQGKDSYGAMVVFVNGQAVRGEYRLFKIKEAPAGDDERALAEVLLRRFQHPEWSRPDILVIDGGRPQISFLKKFLDMRNIAVPVVGISKLGGDRLVFPPTVKKNWRNLVESIKPTLLQAREEAHRFANYGRKRSLKINKKTVLIKPRAYKTKIKGK